MHYAVEYAYGRDVVNHGNFGNEVRAFDTAAARDRWVAQRVTDYTSQSGYREQVPSGHSYVRRWRAGARRYDETIRHGSAAVFFDG